MIKDEIFVMSNMHNFSNLKTKKKTTHENGEKSADENQWKFHFEWIFTKKNSKSNNLTVLDSFDWD